MKQFFDTGSPYLNMLNGFAESMKTNSPHEMLEGVDDEDFKGEGLAILKSAQLEAKRRKALALSKAQQELEEQKNREKPRA